MIERPLRRSLGLFAVLLVALTLSACVAERQKPVHMIRDGDSDLMYGSIIQNNLITEASFYANPKIKIRMRNTSGDLAFDMKGMEEQLYAIYEGKGYERATDDSFGLILDVNVMFSGHLEEKETTRYDFLGPISGTTGRRQKGDLVGRLAGATIGEVLGTFDTIDTYMLIADVNFLVIKEYKKSERRVSFSRSTTIKNVDDPDEEEKVIQRAIKKSYGTQLAVYGGGRNTEQKQVVDEVIQRTLRVVGDFL